MAEVLRRRTKAKDWASDGRRAARMVLDTLQPVSTCARSFAVILLGGGIPLVEQFRMALIACAGLCSVDYMLKIAHFPMLRKHFEERFLRIVTLRTPEWALLESKGYKVFDYDEFIQQRGAPVPL